MSEINSSQDLFDDIVKGGESVNDTRSSSELLAFADEAALQLNKLDPDHRTRLKIRIGRWRGNAFRTKGEYPKAYEHLNTALALALEHGNPAALASIYSDIGWLEYSTGDYSHAMTSFNTALDHAKSYGAPNEIAHAHGNLGSLNATMGNQPVALEEYRKCLHIAEEYDLRTMMASTHSNIGIVLGEMGDESAIDSYNKSIAISKELNNESLLANTYGNVGGYYAGVGNDLAEAERWCRMGLELATKLEMKREQAYYSSALAGLLIGSGRFDEARLVVEKNEILAQSQPEPRISFLLQHASICLHDEEPTKALEFLAEAKMMASSYNLPQKKRDVLEQLRVVHERMENWEEFALLTREHEKLLAELNIEDQKRRISNSEAEHRLSVERRQAEAQRQLLYNTLPNQIADRLLGGAKIVADTYENVSVLFLDVVDFTSISSKIPPGHLIHILNAVFGMCDEVAEKHGLTKVKTIGDSYMAVCGVPEPLTDHAQRAARAAVELLSSLSTLRVTMPEELGDRSWINDIPQMNIRIGIHCGTVVAGVVGTKRLQFDIWGDTVNVASRMETSGQPERIQVSDAFALELTHNAQPAFEGTDVVLRSDQFLCRLRGTMEIKGKGEMKTFWLEVNGQ